MMGIIIFMAITAYIYCVLKYTNGCMLQASNACFGMRQLSLLRFSTIFQCASVSSCVEAGLRFSKTVGAGVSKPLSVV